MIEDQINGYCSFKQGLSAGELERLKALSSGQSPKTCVITCSDSRVDPELITGSKPGEIFVLRNAGNMIPKTPSDGAEVIGTIQFAVEVLGIEDLVICGHTDCGAVKGMLDIDKVSSLSYLKTWLESCNCDELDPSATLEDNVRANAMAQIDRLLSYDFISDRVSTGDLRLHSWVYDLSSVGLSRFDSESRSWVSC